VLLGRYRIERRLGRGGMGEVVLATDELLDRPVALKRIRPETDPGASPRRAILDEARRASRIADRRIAAIYDVVEHGDDVVLVMEYVDGVTLRERMAEPIPMDEFWDLAVQCVEAVAVAHQHGIVHRDIKPDNLMVTTGAQVKVLDFGIARRTDIDVDTVTSAAGTSLETDTRSRHTAGTPQYMAPEAHLGRRVDARADIFSLGVVFYELLTGMRPFDGTTYAAVADQVLHASPPPLAKAGPAVGARLAAVVERMLAKDPQQRFASATDLLHELQRARASDGPAPPAVTPSPGVVTREVDVRVRAAGRRRMRIAALVATAIAVSAAVALLARWRAGAGATLPASRNLAVLAPTLDAGDAFAHWALGAIELTHARLQKHVATPGFQMTSFQEGYDERVHVAADARQVLGANVALLPVISQGPDRLRARLDLAETTRGRIIASRSVETDAAQPFEFLDRVYAESAAMLGLVPDTLDAQAAYGVRGAGTLRFYLQGLGRIRSSSDTAMAERAIEDLQLACRTGPETAVARAALAAAQLKAFNLASDDREQLARAERSAHEAVDLDPARAETHRTLGMVLATARNNADALVAFGRAAELAPTDDDVWGRLGRIHARLGQPEREREVYLAAIAARPHNWQPHWWLATWYFRAGRIDESIAVYEKMVALAPDLHKGYSSLGGALVLHGDYERAIRVLRQAVDLRPTKVAFANLGTAYFNSRDPAQAIDAYNQSFQFGFADYEAWLNLGDAYFWSNGRQAEARDAYTQAIRLAHEEAADRSRSGRSADVMIGANLAAIFPKLGQPDSARIYRDRALAVGGANPMVQYSAALVCWQLGDRDGGLDWLRKSVEGGYPRVWLRDSPMFDEWRELASFRQLAADPSPQPAASTAHR